MDKSLQAIDTSRDFSLIFALAGMPSALSFVWLQGVPPSSATLWWEAPNILACVGLVASTCFALSLYYWAQSKRGLRRGLFAAIGVTGGVIPGSVFLVASCVSDSLEVPTGKILVTGALLGAVTSQMVFAVLMNTKRKHKAQSESARKRWR